MTNAEQYVFSEDWGQMNKPLRAFESKRAIYNETWAMKVLVVNLKIESTDTRRKRDFCEACFY